mgnify:CR=1 FL=1
MAANCFRENFWPKQSTSKSSTKAGDAREVPLQHRRRGDERIGLRRIGALPRTLISEKEEQLVSQDGPADHSPELVPLQGIPRGGEAPRES